MCPGVNITNCRGFRVRRSSVWNSCIPPAPAMPEAESGGGGSDWAMNEISSLSIMSSGRTKVVGSPLRRSSWASWTRI